MISHSSSFLQKTSLNSSTCLLTHLIQLPYALCQRNLSQVVIRNIYTSLSKKAVLFEVGVHLFGFSEIHNNSGWVVTNVQVSV